MSFFARLFRKVLPTQAAGPKSAEPRRPVDSAAARAAAVKQVEGQRLAAADAAATRLPSGPELVALANDPQSGSQKAAQQRLAQLLDAGDTDIVRLNGQIADKTTLLSIAALAASPEPLQQAAALVVDRALWMKLVTMGQSTKVRQLAAEQIDDPAQLRQLLKDTRGKDKNAYKIIRRKCDALQAQDKLVAERQAAIVVIAETLERHSFKPFDGAFIATLEHLNAQWNAAGDDSPEEMRPRVALAVERAREVISQHVEAVGAQAAKSHAVETADPQRQLIVEEMRLVLTSAFASDVQVPADLASRTVTQLDRWSERWRDTTRHKPAGLSDVATFERLRQAITRASQLLGQHGSLRHQLDAIDAVTGQDLTRNIQALQSTLAVTASVPGIEWPADIATATSAVQAWNRQRADEQAAITAALNHVTGLIRRASYAINDGRSAQAASIRRNLAAALPSLASVPNHVAGQIEQLDKRLNELQDWKSYAVAPKRAQLIEQMTALIGVEQHPAELADEIKRLQEEWKSLTKGAVEHSDEDWQKFHEAAQAAYQPCRDYFAEQARIREENLERRKAMVAHLTQFDNDHDWANADWKEVSRVLRQSRQEWRNYQPTERTANKPVQSQFDALVKNMQDRLDAQYTTNIGRKQSLIQQVQRLLGEADMRKAIDDVKRLQTAWKTAGIVPHVEDQRLWEEFRQHCDAVYHKSQAEYSAFVAELETNKTQLLDLIGRADGYALLEGAELSSAASAIRQLRVDFEAIGELPRHESAELQSRFQRAIERYEQALVEQRLRDEQRSWSHLFAASNEIRLLQHATVSQVPATEIEALQQSVRSTIDGVQHWPRGGLQAIERKLVQPLATDMAANEAALRQLCVRAELLTDSSTPAVDQQRRRDYQLQTLVQGMGQARQSGKDALEALVFEWISVGPVDTTSYYELLARFNECLVKAQRLLS